jgi:hypothetical protein
MQSHLKKKLRVRGIKTCQLKRDPLYGVRRVGSWTSGADAGKAALSVDTMREMRTPADVIMSGPGKGFGGFVRRGV